MLKLDSGNFRDIATPAGDTRTDALLAAMDILGYQIANVAERDVRLGYDEFLRHTEGLDLRFVSANLVREDTGEPLFPPHIVLEAVSADGKSKRLVGVIGVVRANPLFREAGPGESRMVIADPVERVRAEVEKLRARKVDTIVVLAALHKFHAKKILEEIEGIDFVLGSHGETVTRSAESYGTGRLVYGGNRGTHITETRIFLDDRFQDSVRVHYLSGKYSFDPKMAEYVNSIYRETGPEETSGNEICEDGTGS